MKTTVKRQKAKVGVAGSFINQLMSNNESIPVVGKGATIMGYTDRKVAQVVEVSEDGKTVKMETLDTRSTGGQIGDQNWEHHPTGQYYTLKWRNNAWRRVCPEVVFTKEIIEQCAKTGHSASKTLTKEQKEAVYGDHFMPINVVEGLTELKYSYPKVNILFGQMDYYYDWSF